MLGAVNPGVADDGECTGHEHLPICCCCRAYLPLSAASEGAQSRPRVYVLIGRSCEPWASDEFERVAHRERIEDRSAVKEVLAAEG
jgi:hypothetical protein